MHSKMGAENGDEKWARKILRAREGRGNNYFECWLQLIGIGVFTDRYLISFVLFLFFFLQLSCCSTLGLFATSSEDHCVKIWNSNNQLVREMCFDESLCGVCFANSRGDILVGFQCHISLVTILKYLPLTYLKILSKMHFENDSFEDHVQFNDLLKFWYDPDRVPIMPLKASKRITLEPPDVKRFMKRKKVTLVENMKFIYARKLCVGNDFQRERSLKFTWQLKRLQKKSNK